MVRVFTFHNVSINTEKPAASRRSYSTLHSTMFLLIRSAGVAVLVELASFTFHNVSINTRAPHSPIIHRLFYHFLSTLSFTIILYTK